MNTFVIVLVAITAFLLIYMRLTKIQQRMGILINLQNELINLKREKAGKKVNPINMILD